MRGFAAYCGTKEDMDQIKPRSHDAPEQEGLPSPGAESLLLNAKQVAQAMGIGRTKAYELMAAGVLPVVTIGTAPRVPAEALRAWIARNTTGGETN